MTDRFLRCSSGSHSKLDKVLITSLDGKGEGMGKEGEKGGEERGSEGGDNDSGCRIGLVMTRLGSLARAREGCQGLPLPIQS